MGRNEFRFKHFSCRHFGSTMRIGVDAVLLGAWADVTGRRILDVGTGCGVIALMCAQRSVSARIEAIDVDIPSVNEASLNFAASPWSDRLEARVEDFMALSADQNGRFDLIISNPPYFNSGVDPGFSSRMLARHDGSLSPLTLLSHGRELLTEYGRIAMVIPRLRVEEILDHAGLCGLYLLRRTDVQGNPKAPVKRTLIEFGLDTSACPVNGSLILEEAPSIPTEEHRALCKDFYLMF